MPNRQTYNYCPVLGVHFIPAQQLEKFSFYILTLGLRRKNSGLDNFCWVSPNLQAINAENIAKEAKELSLSKIWKEALPKLMRKIH